MFFGGVRFCGCDSLEEGDGHVEIESCDEERFEKGNRYTLQDSRLRETLTYTGQINQHNNQQSQVLNLNANKGDERVRDFGADVNNRPE